MGIYNTITLSSQDFSGVTTHNLKGIYNMKRNILRGIFGVTTHNLKGIYNKTIKINIKYPIYETYQIRQGIYQ